MEENKELKLVYENRKRVTVEDLGDGRYQVCTCACASNEPSKNPWSILKQSGMKYDFKGQLCPVCNYWPWVRK